MRKIIFLIIAVFILFIGSVSAETTQIEVGTDMGEYAAIAVGTDDVVHISHLNGVSDLRYCNNTGSSWSCEQVFTSVGGGQFNSLALDSGNNPHIAYHNGSILYFNKTGGVWSYELIYDDSDSYPSISIDTSDVPHIAFQGDDDLRYCNRTGDSWTCDLIESSSDGDGTSIAIDTSNNVHITHYSSTEARYCVNSTWGTWNCETIEKVGSLGALKNTGLFIDSNSIPHATITNNTNSVLRYCNRTGGSWSCENVSDADDDYPSMVLNLTDTVFIVSDDRLSSGITLCNNSAGSWACGDISGDLYVSQPAMAMKRGRLADSISFSDYLHIAYQLNGDLYYYTTQPTPLQFTEIPQNTTSVYEANFPFIDFNATSVNTWWTNDTTRFNITQDGVLLNATILGVDNYTVNVSINDSSNIVNSTLWLINVTPSADRCDIVINETSLKNSTVHVNVSTNCTSNFELRVNSSQVANGSNSILMKGHYNISVTRNDTQNYSVIADETFLIVNNSPPGTPTLNYPPDEFATANNYVLLNFSSTDNDNDSLVYYVYNGTSTSQMALLDISSNETINLTNIPSGTHYWTVMASDNESNSSNATTFKFTISTVNPAVTLEYPTNNLYLNTQTVEFNFTASDSDGLSTCELWSNTTGTWHKNQTIYTIVSGGVTNFSTLTLVDEANYTWNVWCNDTNNLGSWGTANFTLVIDATNPLFSVTTPAMDTTYATTTFVITNTLTDYDIDECNYSLFYKDTGTFKQSAAITCNNPDTISAGYYSAGYILNVYAFDNANNFNSTQINFTLKQTTPNPGGGSGPQTIIQGDNATEALQEALICGNGICQEGESPLSCPQDCPINIDSLFCPLFGGDCPAWAFNFLILLVIGIILGVVYKRQVKKR